MAKSTNGGNVLLYTAGYIAYLFSQWIVSMVIVRISGLEDAGYFGIASTLAGVFYMVASYGIRSYQISDLKPLFQDADYVCARIVTTIIAFLACVVYSFATGYAWNQILIISIYMIFKCCEALYDVLHGIWQKNDRLTAVGVSLFIKALASVVCFLIPYIATRNLTLGLVVMAASAIVLLGLDVHFTTKRVGVTHLLGAGKEKVFSLLKATFVMMALITCSPILTAIPRIVLEKSAGPEILGIYTSLATPMTLISAFASTVFLPLIPRYTLAYNDGNGRQVKRLICVSGLTMIAVGCAAACAIHWFGYWAVNLVYGEVVADYYRLMYGVVVSVVLSSIIMCLNNFLTGIRKLKHELAFMVLGCILCLIISLLFIPRFSITGAIWATVVSQLIQIVVEIIYIMGVLNALKRRSGEA